MEENVSIVRRGWKPCADPKVCKMYNEVVEECRKKFPHSNIYGLDKTIYCTGGVRSYGMCVSTKVCGIVLSAIMINDNLIAAKNEKDIRDTIIHEVAHAAAPIHSNHNATWKHIGNTIGQKWNIRVQRTNNKQVSHENAPYVLQCCNCGATWIRNRSSNLVKHPERFSHGNCPIGSIKLIRVHGKEVV